jgi:hypothetical protein
VHDDITDGGLEQDWCWYSHGNFVLVWVHPPSSLLLLLLVERETSVTAATAGEGPPATDADCLLLLADLDEGSSGIFGCGRVVAELVCDDVMW